MKRYYDKINNRLVYIGKASNSDFWDKHWNDYSFSKMYPVLLSPFDYVIRNTKKYLKKGSTIIEGGCGIGQEVYKLQKYEYKVIGIDYAEKTVAIVNKFKPELEVRIGDVRILDFEDNTFDGYWSFGVIEHFYNGYDEIIAEMKRVIKPNGYLFINFPHMSKLRNKKAKNDNYKIWKNDDELIKNFYQFALDHKTVIEKLKEYDFCYVKKQHLTGIKGLKDEVSLFKKLLQKIFDSRSIPIIALSKFISFIFNRYSSHSILIVMQNKKNRK